MERGPGLVVVPSAERRRARGPGVAVCGFRRCGADRPGPGRGVATVLPAAGRWTGSGRARGGSGCDGGAFAHADGASRSRGPGLVVVPSAERRRARGPGVAVCGFRRCGADRPGLGRGVATVLPAAGQRCRKSGQRGAACPPPSNLFLSVRDGSGYRGEGRDGIVAIRARNTPSMQCSAHDWTGILRVLYLNL